MLGVDGLSAIFSDLCESNSNGIADGVFSGVQAFRGSWPAEDDATALIVRVRDGMAIWRPFMLTLQPLASQTQRTQSIGPVRRPFELPTELLQDVMSSRTVRSSHEVHFFRLSAFSALLTVSREQPVISASS